MSSLCELIKLNKLNHLNYIQAVYVVISTARHLLKFTKNVEINQTTLYVENFTL